MPRRAQQQGHAARLQPSADPLEDLPHMPLPVHQMHPVQQAPCLLHKALQPGLAGVTAQAATSCASCAVHLDKGTWQECAAARSSAARYTLPETSRGTCCCWSRQQALAE